MKPALLLDVDGVLSPFASQAPSWDDWFEGPTAYDLELSPKMAQAVISLPADIHWLTTWEGQANTFISPALGWPQFPVLDRYGSESVTWRWWKHDAAAEWYLDNPGRPFAWVDDDHEHYPEAKEWADELDVPTLVICTDRNLGITQENLAQLDDFFTDLWDPPIV